MKVAFHTLGCKVNQNDTESLASMFRERGYTIVSFEQTADVYIINTCSVTNLGERKSRQSIRRATKVKPTPIVVVTGCYAQTAPGEAAGIPGVNLVVGMAERPRLVDLVEEYRKNRQNKVEVGDIGLEKSWIKLPVSKFTERTRSTLKVQEGCDQFCSYCIVPLARGGIRSMPLMEAVKEFKSLVENGYREIVLTGIHLGAYGKDLGLSLADLLKELLKIPGDYRIRLGSLEPNDFDRNLLGIILNNARICQHLHIPLQSGSDHILKLMNRRYTLADYSGLLKQIRAANPLLAVGTDLIVGFPGETEADFAATLEFIEEQAFSRVHVFRFSPRKGTPAATFKGRVAGPVMEERSRKVQAVAFRTGREFARQFVGKRVETLFEEKIAGGWTGLSGEYLRTEVLTGLDLKNTVREVLITGISGHILKGNLPH
ncbi:MAG: tRNA (N(6)-L-threonylcarbamoyladenosine(37)-C(2))-methylthiotransferase MtaB [Firmicutes bacterium]|nr:tRNA (N(6)-L-threonylcarbamoyladenosine(37)-C(2))-methylthiotransferase MtaB [Bacillota bacterium]